MRKFFNLFQRETRSGSDAYSFDLPEECQVSINVTSDGPVTVFCTDLYGELHPLFHAPDGRVQQTTRIKGADALVVKPAKKAQSVSLNVASRGIGDTEAGQLDPTGS